MAVNEKCRICGGAIIKVEPEGMRPWYWVHVDGPGDHEAERATWVRS